MWRVRASWWQNVENFQDNPDIIIENLWNRVRERIDDFETNYEFMKFTEFRIVDDVGSSAFYI